MQWDPPANCMQEDPPDNRLQGDSAANYMQEDPSDYRRQEDPRRFKFYLSPIVPFVPRDTRCSEIPLLATLTHS